MATMEFIIDWLRTPVRKQRKCRLLLILVSWWYNKCKYINYIDWIFAYFLRDHIQSPTWSCVSGHTIANNIYMLNYANSLVSWVFGQLPRRCTHFADVINFNRSRCGVTRVLNRVLESRYDLRTRQLYRL